MKNNARIEKVQQVLLEFDKIYLKHNTKYFTYVPKVDANNE